MRKPKLSKADKSNIKQMIKIAKWIWPKEAENLTFTNNDYWDGIKKMGSRERLLEIANK